MFLNLLLLTPYIAIVASVLLIVIATAVCVQLSAPAKTSGFSVSRDRRAVAYRGFVKADRGNQFREAA